MPSCSQLQLPCDRPMGERQTRLSDLSDGHGGLVITFKGSLRKTPVSSWSRGHPEFRRCLMSEFVQWYSVVAARLGNPPGSASMCLRGNGRNSYSIWFCSDPKQMESDQKEIWDHKWTAFLQEYERLNMFLRSCLKILFQPYVSLYLMEKNNESRGTINNNTEKSRKGV